MKSSNRSNRPPLAGKRILVTHAKAFMAPVLCEVLVEQGAEVILSNDALLDPEAPGALVAATGHIDILVANQIGRAHV